MAKSRHLHMVMGDVNVIYAAMKRSHRWNTTQDDRNQLLEKVLTLKQILSTADDLDQIDAKTFLLPFLDIIRAEDTSVVVTLLALSTVQKILSYKMLETRTKAEIASVVDQISEAVTHARFVGTDPASDEGVLMKIIYVLKSLVLSVPGNLLTNESLCEIAGSLFRMCLEPRLSELLRKVAETLLMEIMLHLFVRLPELAEGSTDVKRTVKKLHRHVTKRRAPSPPPQAIPAVLEAPPVPTDLPTSETATTKVSGDITVLSETTAAKTTVDGNCHSTGEASEPGVVFSVQPQVNLEQGDVAAVPTADGEPGNTSTWSVAEALTTQVSEESGSEEESEDAVDQDVVENVKDRKDFVNDRGITFRTALPKNDETGAYIPYGLPAVQEILRFMISLIHPYDKNPETNLNLGLNLLTTSIETAAPNLPKYSTLLNLVKDDLCRNLSFLLQSDRLSIFTLTLRLAFFVFEAMRDQLKLQLEHFLIAVMDLISTEGPRVTQEHKEAALDMIVRLWRLPNFITELYYNYDCDLYCTNLFEDLTKVLSKNAFPVSGLNPVHLLSLDCLMMAVEKIERNCQSVVSTNLASKDVLLPVVAIQNATQQLKQKKKLLITGTELFNKKPSRGIECLQEHGVLSTPLVAEDVVKYLRDYDRLDKAAIADYISDKKNIEILQAYVRSFNLSGKRLDEALREFLEAFRIPGEAPVIFHLLTYFSINWYSSNGNPFVHHDAALTLAYAVLMLNTDQHNKNAKKQNVPMTANDFKKNLRGVNKREGQREPGQDFDPKLLEALYEAIKKEEIIMPAEQTGLVKELYHWKVLLRQSEKHKFHPVTPGAFDGELFALLWGPTVAALSYAFDKTSDDFIIRKTITGFKKCAIIAASPAIMSCEVFDSIVVTLCKFSTLLNSYDSLLALMVAFGQNTKGQLATKTVFTLAHRHGDILREGWKNIVECIVQLFRARLLPEHLNEADDFVSGVVSLIREEPAQPKQENGYLSSFLNFITSDSASKSATTLHEEAECKKMARACIDECEIGELINDSKFLQIDSMKEFVAALMASSKAGRKPVDASPTSGAGVAAEEQAGIICLEILVKVLIQNRDRLGEKSIKLWLWPAVHDYFFTTLLQESRNEMSFLNERAVVGLLRLAVRFLPRDDKELRQDVMRSLRLLLGIRLQFFSRLSRQISFGLSQLFQTNASANIQSKDTQSKEDWRFMFTLLECSGAGVRSSIAISKELPKSESQQINTRPELIDTDRGYTSDSELYENRSLSPAGSSTWLMVGREGEVVETGLENGDSLVFPCEFYHHDTQAFFQAIDSLRFLIRGTGPITPQNVPSLVHCLCVFAEASVNGSGWINQRVQATALKRADRTGHLKRENRQTVKHSKAASQPASPGEEDGQKVNLEYEKKALEVLDLMESLFKRVASVEELKSSCWRDVWCPLLRQVARLCCDNRKSVRMHALGILQGLSLKQGLSPSEWDVCLNKVFFPLLSALRTSASAQDSSVEDVRKGIVSIIRKAFLQHFTSLIALPTFESMWMLILDNLYSLKSESRSDSLKDDVLESVRIMLLFMIEAGIFQNYQTPLWEKTRGKVDSIDPGMAQHLIDATKTALNPPSALPSPVSIENISCPQQQQPSGPPLLLDPGILQRFEIPVLALPKSVGSLPSTPTEAAQESPITVQPPVDV